MLRHTRPLKCSRRRLIRGAPASLWGLVLVSVLSVGCGGRPDSQRPSTGDAASHLELPAMSAAEFLQQVMARYRNTRHYSDRGEVLLRVARDGRVVRRTAPMHVCLSGPAVWVAAYDARLWADAEQTVGWIADEQTDFHDSQVVVGAASTDPREQPRSDAMPAVGGSTASERPVLENLLRDPLLTTRMVSGLGGPPPQLEWLLEGDPMAKLFREDPAAAASETQKRQIRYGSTAMRDGVPCVSVVASVGDDSYQFWIDRQRSCIKSVELPIAIAGKGIEMEGWVVESLELELHQASFEPWPGSFQLSQMPKATFPDQPKYVRALVPLPPAAPHRRMGSTLPEFSVGDKNGRFRITAAGGQTPLTLWLAGTTNDDADPAAPEFLPLVQSLSTWLMQDGSPQSQQLRAVALVEDVLVDPLMRAGIDNTPWVVVRDRRGELSERIGLQPNQLMLSNQSRRILWIGDGRDAGDVASLAAVVQDALHGTDVPNRLQRQWQADRQAYLSKLQELRYSGTDPGSQQ